MTIPARTTNEIALPSARHIGQATAIEQSRAAAEVHAAVLVAQQVPRDVQAAIAQMRDSCRITSLAERAFFRYNRGGSQVSGPSVHLARELARCWGNIQYGVAELRRDDAAGESEMQAYAWDVQTNARTATIFIVPHKRDTKKDGAKPLTELRDIYENNANQAARRVRECIFAVLPPWYTEEAKDLCNKTLAEGGQVPIEQRRAEVIKNFADLGVTEDDLVRKLDRPPAKWTAHDLAQLWVIGKSIQRGEVTRDDEFPPLTITKDDIAAARTDAVPPPSAEASAEQPTEPQPAAGESAAPAQLVAKLKRQLVDLQVTKPADQLKVIGQIVGRKLSAWNEITTQDGARAADLLVRALKAEQPGRALDALLGEIADAQDGES